MDSIKITADASPGLTRSTRGAVALALLLLGLALIALPSAASGSKITLVAPPAVPGTNPGTTNLTTPPLISDDGRTAVFLSQRGAYLLDPPPGSDLHARTEGVLQVYVWRAGQGVDVASRASDGAVANSFSGANSSTGSVTPPTYLKMTPDGRYVLFQSQATNLAPGVDGSSFQLYLRDLETNKTELISRSDDGTPANQIAFWGAVSGNGRYVAFSTTADNLDPDRPAEGGPTGVYVRDRQAGTTKFVSHAPDGSRASRIDSVRGVSDDGTKVLVVGYSDSTLNPIPGGTTGTFSYVIDTEGGPAVPATVDAGGEPVFAPATRLSGNGRFVLFNQSGNIYRHDIETGEVDQVTIGYPEPSGDTYLEVTDISEDGRFIAWTGHGSHVVTPEYGDQLSRSAFVTDMELGVVHIASANLNGERAMRQTGTPPWVFTVWSDGYSSGVSANGRYAGVGIGGSNGAGFSEGDQGSGARAYVKDLAEPPAAVTTGDVSAITDQGATAAGEVDPGLAYDWQDAEYSVEWGPGPTTGFEEDDDLLEWTGSAPGGDLAATDGPRDVSVAITGLRPETLYHYRIVAESPGGVTKGIAKTFTTGAAPTCETDASLCPDPTCETDASLCPDPTCETDASLCPKPEGRPRLGALKVTPKAKRIGRGRSFRLRATVRNPGNAALSGARICLRLPKGALRGARCVRLGRIAAGRSVTRRFKVTVKRNARVGRSFTARVVATAPGQKARRTAVKVRTRR